MQAWTKAEEVAEEVVEEAAATAFLECAICLNELYSFPCARLSHLGVLVCSHVLHMECAMNVKDQFPQSLCPLCRVRALRCAAAC